MSNPVGYAPIRLRGNGPVTMELPYSFVYDLEMLRDSNGEGNVNEPFVPGGARRKKRQLSDPALPVEQTLQTVEISFRPVEVGTTDLLHTESKDFIHQLRVSLISQDIHGVNNHSLCSMQAFTCISMSASATLKTQEGLGMRLKYRPHLLLPV